MTTTSQEVGCCSTYRRAKEEKEEGVGGGRGAKQRQRFSKGRGRRRSYVGRALVLRIRSNTLASVGVGGITDHGRHNNGDFGIGVCRIGDDGVVDRDVWVVGDHLNHLHVGANVVSHIVVEHIDNIRDIEIIPLAVAARLEIESIV